MDKHSNVSPYDRPAQVPGGEQPGLHELSAPGGRMEHPTIPAGTVESLWKEMRIAFSATVVLALVLCGIYPLAVWGVAQLAFPQQANGSLIVRDGSIVGSDLIGQRFKGERYFHPRPSAAGSDGYDAAASSGSNLGPLSQKLVDQVQERADAYRLENGLPPGTEIPADAVTASASGLDPHISGKDAELQAARVAKARAIPIEEMRKLIGQRTQGPQFGFFGEQRVNVLKLNLALDGLSVKR